MLTIEDLQGNRKQRRAEIVTRRIFQAAALFSILVSLLILFVLGQGTWDFFVGIDWNFDVLTDTGWFPRRERFDLRTIIVGSIVVGSIAMLVAAPLGLGVAIYLAEYAPSKVRAVVKPVIELLAGLPSVVVGFFALKFIAPEVVDRIFDPTQSRNMLVAGLGIGILVIPIMASLSEDSISAVPGSLREASYGVGAKKVTTVTKIVLPAAISGLVAAFIIATSRAIGETMVATMAGGYDGSGPYNGFNPLEPGLTMTAAMTNAAGGTDAVKAGPPFDVLFFVGLLLFFITLGLNTIGARFVARVRQKY
ncbi:MAG: phosphate ABC transporter permease subunit PstC [Ilumatobacteraceae bacterium]|jgi:phosphate transport system permease protein|nr:phosphate ABC transporter permease subunit PstC [Ilumatobacteraceae bacterium]